jgi:hypothetical protein
LDHDVTGQPAEPDARKQWPRDAGEQKYQSSYLPQRLWMAPRARARDKNAAFHNVIPHERENFPYKLIAQEVRGLFPEIVSENFPYKPSSLLSSSCLHEAVTIRAAVAIAVAASRAPSQHDGPRFSEPSLLAVSSRQPADDPGAAFRA